MHLPDLPEVSPILDDIVVGLVPRADDSDFGTRKFGQRMEPDIVYGGEYEAQYVETSCVQKYNGPRWYFHLV